MIDTQASNNNNNNNNFKIKGYSGISFLYSNWTYSFLLVVQLVALGFFLQGLIIYFQYDKSNDWRVGLLWAGAIIATVSCIFISISTFANNQTFFKIGLFFVGITLIITLLDIGLLVSTKNSNVGDLQYCSKEKSIEPSTCVKLWGQQFCGNYIILECAQLSRGFKKLLLSQAAVSLVQAFYIGLSLLKLFRQTKRKSSSSYRPLIG
ncbi:hypothetical protein ACTFIR_004240 [Dictyostelium discoideum]